jgi:superfamily II DNA or RNA helicase
MIDSDRCFTSPRSLLGGGARRFCFSVERLLYHVGFQDVRLIDGAGDGGADLLAVLGKELFVFQCKWTTRDAVDRAGIDEVERAKAKYSADRAVLVTNARLGNDAIARQRALARIGVQIEAWSGRELLDIFDEVPSRMPSPIRLRPYQEEAVRRVIADLDERKRALLILATGLGKTVVGGEVIADHIARCPNDDILVVAHLKELVQQLERALWKHIPKEMPSQVLTGEQRPPSLSGLTCATVESAFQATLEGYRPGLVMVDETHHVGESGLFQKLLDTLESAQQFGVTATPWRGDAYDITGRFGPASFKMGIAEGMAGGFLSQVDYRLLLDDIDWAFVRRASQHQYSVKELNQALFIPERDEAVLEHLLRTWQEIADPRAIVFCQTIEHAERVSDLLSRSSPMWRRAASIHSRQTKRERETLMTDFRLGRVPIMTARDVFNEGLDVPDVNIICFLRVTHSRRIFVQQLGRGLRLREGKDRVIVLDFATDIRRIAATLDLKRDLERRREAIETLHLSHPAQVRFSNAQVSEFMEAWIKDAASLETAADDARLNFPDIPNSIY